MQRHDQRRGRALAIARRHIDASHARIEADSDCTHFQAAIIARLRMRGSDRGARRDQGDNHLFQHGQTEASSTASRHTQKRERRRTHTKVRRLAFLESALLHAPDQMIEPVLAEERFMLEHKERHTPMAGVALVRFVACNFGGEIVGVIVD